MTTRISTLALIITACHHGCQCRAGSIGDKSGGDDIDDEGYCRNWCRSRHYTCGHTQAHIDGIDCRGCNNFENDYGENVLYMKLL